MAPTIAEIAAAPLRHPEALAPYRLTWIEDYAQPDDWPGYADVRRRLPSQMLAAGERWYTSSTPPSPEHPAGRRILGRFRCLYDPILGREPEEPSGRFNPRR